MTRRSPTPRALSFETHEGVEPLQEEWDALAERTGASPFARPGWIAAWYAAFARGRPLVAAVRREGVLTGVAALEAQGRTLRSATNWHTPQYDVVAESRDAARALADGLIATRPGRLELRFLDADGLALPALGAAATAAGYRTLTRRLLDSPYLTVDGSWDAYASQLSRSMLSGLARKRRGLEREHGPVSFGIETTPDGERHHLETAFRLEASGWKGRAGTAIASQPETRAFYTSVARWASERGWLRLAFLSASGHPLAFELGLEVDGVVYNLKPGYDETYARFRPGKLLTEDILRSAFDRGARGYEFLGAAARHKLEWTSHVRERLILQAFAPTPAGLAQLAAFRIGRPAALRALRGYGWLRARVTR